MAMPLRKNHTDNPYNVRIIQFCHTNNGEIWLTNNFYHKNKDNE